jgi:hypothetical protein
MTRQPSLHSHYRSFITTTRRSASRTRNGTHTRARRGLLPISHRKAPVRSIRSGLLPFRARAADRARVASMPDTIWPINGHPPDSSRDRFHTPVSMPSVFISTRQQRIACARLPDPHLTHHVGLFHIAHHDHVTTLAACGGLKPPPAGRLRRASNPSSPAQHRIRQLYLHRTPFHARDTQKREFCLCVACVVLLHPDHG